MHSFDYPHFFNNKFVLNQKQIQKNEDISISGGGGG